MGRSNRHLGPFDSADLCLPGEGKLLLREQHCSFRLYPLLGLGNGRSALLEVVRWEKVGCVRDALLNLEKVSPYSGVSSSK